MTLFSSIWLLSILLAICVFGLFIAIIVVSIRKKSKKHLLILGGVLLAFLMVASAFYCRWWYKENKWFVDFREELYEQHSEIDKVKMSLERWGLEIRVYGEKLDETTADMVIEDIDKMLFEEEICPLFMYDEREYPPCSEVWVYFIKNESDPHGFCEYSAGYYYDGSRERIDNFQTWHKSTY